MGESMGGAMILRLHRKLPDFWDGAVLVAPMCKVCSENMPRLFCCMLMENFDNPYSYGQNCELFLSIVSQNKLYINLNQKCPLPITGTS